MLKANRVPVMSGDKAHKGPQDLHNLTQAPRDHRAGMDSYSGLLDPLQHVTLGPSLAPWAG